MPHTSVRLDDPVNGKRRYTMETFAVDGFPETKLVLALFKNVENAHDLKSKHLNRVALLDAGVLQIGYPLCSVAASRLPAVAEKPLVMPTTFPGFRPGPGCIPPSTISQCRSSLRVPVPISPGCDVLKSLCARGWALSDRVVAQHIPAARGSGDGGRKGESGENENQVTTRED